MTNKKEENKNTKTGETQVGETQVKEKRVKKISGVVVSDKMDKTLIVRVDRVKVHPKYKKRYFTGKRYKVHDEKGQFKEGDNVVFVECRPLSKDKRWRVLYS